MAISIFNRKKQFYSPEVEGLIKQLTGFEEDDRNYQEVERFVYSNIIHHNFATVDITKVKDSVGGYIEKFEAHGLRDRARRFKELVDKYIASDSSQHTQLNVQWHVLYLLINLSTRPTAVPEEDLRVEELPEFINQEEDINWSEYLREGLDEFKLPSDDSDDELEWLSVSSKGVPAAAEESPSDLDVLPSFGDIPHPSLWQPGPPRLSKHETLCRVIREGRQAEQWLHNNVQHSWWVDSSWRDTPSSRYPEANMCRIWEEYQQSRSVQDSVSIEPKLLVISEFKVLQEVLWMLQVPSESALFSLDDNDQFQVKSNISMPSTIPESCSLYLERFCPYINMVYSLRNFEEILNEQEMGDNPPPVTYKAYCAALCRHLLRFTNIVIDIETRVNKQDETMTLLSVMEELSPGLKILQYLHSIHTRAVTDWVSVSAWFCVTRLLSILYEILCEASDEEFLEISLDIFIHTFHPYLDIIDIWLCEGRLEDWRKEFLVMKEDDGAPEVMPYEMEMLRCGVTPVTFLTRLVDVVREAGSTMEIVSSLNKLQEFRNTVRNKGCLFKEFCDNVNSEIKRMKEKISETSEVEKENSDVVSEKSSYISVKSSVNDLIENNIDRLAALNKTKETQQVKFNSDAKNMVISDTLSPDTGRSKNGRGDVPCVSAGVTKSEQGDMSVIKKSEISLYMLSVSDAAMYDQAMSALLHNPLLGEVFSSYHHSTVSTDSKVIESAVPQEATDCSASLVGLMSIHSVLERQLSLVESRHRSASRLVTDILLREHDLRGHFSVLRTVYFMENGNLAQSFYCYLFKEIEAGTWNNIISLNAQLKICIEEYFPGFENYFTVQINVPKGERVIGQSVHRVIPAINLSYRVDWPLSLVISEDMIESYNKVFRFLLHLKYAFWTLHNIRFSDLVGSPAPLQVRRLHVLKMWMLHSTNTLHSYFMGLVLRSYSTHLEESVQSADSLQVIVEAHKRFLDEVKIHCLQDKKNYLESFIKKLLKLCSTLADLWATEAAGEGDVVEAQLGVVEEAFLTAYHGLIHCLDMVSPDEDQGNFLYELKCEIASSEPEYFTVDIKEVTI